MVYFCGTDSECGTPFSLRLLLLVIAYYLYANGQQGILNTYNTRIATVPSTVSVCVYIYFVVIPCSVFMYKMV